MKLFINLYVVSSILLLVSCASDRPAPDDADAREWTPTLKKAHSDWQPTKDVPVGNSEYEEALLKNKNDNSKNDTEREIKDSAEGISSVSEENKQEKQQEKTVVEQEKEQTEKNIVPANNASANYALINIDDDKSLLVLNGVEKSDEEIDGFLVEHLKEHADFSLIIYFEENARERLQTFVERVKKLGVKNINAMSRSDLMIAQLNAVAKKEGMPPIDSHNGTSIGSQNGSTPKKISYSVDKTVEESTYVVEKGDTLSLIAKKIYHDGALWPAIFDANKETLKNDPHHIGVGVKLKIPALKINE